MIYVEVQGDGDAGARFQRKGDAIRGRMLRALGVVGEEIRAAAALMAPSSSGRLARSIRARVTERPNGDAVLSVRPGKAGWYGVFAEFQQRSASAQVKGYSRRNETASVHAVSKRGKVMKRLAAQGIVFVKAHSRPVHLKHHPFMTPAIAQVRGHMAQLFSSALREAVAE